MSNFSIVSFDTSLLANYYGAKTNLRVTSALSSANFSTSSGPRATDITTPWDTADERSLSARYNEVRDKRSFINLSDDEVQLAGSDQDAKALFALYTALEDLKTIAEYAAADTTSSSLLEKIGAKYSEGMIEVQEYLQGLELEKLTLFAGEKKANATTEVTLGKNTYEYTSPVSFIGTKYSAIPGLNGDEVFTITVGDGTESDDIVIDLSQISGTVSMTSLTNYINGQIGSLTKLNGEGEEVPKYDTEFKIEEVEDGRFSLMIDGGIGESVAFSAAVSDPTVYLVGNTSKGSSGTDTASITKLKDNGTSGNILSMTNHAATDSENPLHEIKDADGELVEQDPIAEQTTASASAMDSQGNLYVLGTTVGDLGSNINVAETSDVYLSKFDSVGNLVWSRLVGATDTAEAFDIAIDGEDNVVIAGQIDSELEDLDIFSGKDSFVIKYDDRGTELWTQQLDSAGTDSPASLAIDASGNVYVTGEISGAYNGSVTAGGGQDAYVMQLDSTTGAVAQVAQFGGAGTETGQAIAIDADGNVLVASEEDGQAVIRTFDANDLSSQLSSHVVGDLAGGEISDIVIDGGSVYLAGTSSSASFSGGGAVVAANSGGRDGFVISLANSAGNLSANWTTFLGTGATDSIEDLTVANGSIFVAGTTGGALPGDTKSGYTDAFAAKINGSTGATDWVQQVGAAESLSAGVGIGFSSTGSSVLNWLGLPTGEVGFKETRDIETQTTAAKGDYFYISVNDRTPLKIKIMEGDDFYDLAERINKRSFRYLNASVTTGDGGQRLKIATKNGGTVELISGEGSQDALRKLGLEPTKVLSSEELFDIGEDTAGTDPNDLGGAFGLEIKDLTQIRSKQEAEYIANQLTNALTTVSRAYRSMFYDPVKAAILKDSQAAGNGQVPAHLTAKIANYQAGLNRLLAGSGSSGAGVLF
ncbi:SBBP repeat-containing protein [Emcibacter sp.]|uniref:SBBP repeat-containing protein n=1 Tax=Emcibacter sp. TaxID=1979954 RepID=UPI003A8F9CE3